jgi:hypothetical protein
MAEALNASELPTVLALPVLVSGRNAEHKVDVKGQATRLDETGFVANFPDPIPDGTILFTTIDMRNINAMARGLAKVKSQTPMGENAGYQTYADFIDLNDDGKQKIAKMLGGGRSEGFTQAPARNFAVEQLGTLPGMGPLRTGGPGNYGGGPANYQVTQEGRRSYFEPAPLRAVAQPTASTKFWNSLGVTAYIAALLIVVALFPQGRAFELMVLHNIGYVLGRMWYWANHIGNVQLYNNT